MTTLPLIGKGLFSKVYKLNEKQVLIKSTCWSKECLALFVEAKHFPKLEVVGEKEYVCEFYPRVKSLKDSLKPSHYKVYQQLRQIDRLTTGGYDDLKYLFNTVSNKSFRESLLNTLDDMTNYSLEVCFEISPRNVAVKNGNLILLDVFFFREQIREKRNLPPINN